jgi:protein pelota
VKLGQYHSLELALQRNFTLTKPHWDSIYLDRIDMACDLKTSAEIAAVVMQPGLANVCLVTTHMTQVRQKIEMAIPRKRVGSTSGHDTVSNRQHEMRRHHYATACITLSSAHLIFLLFRAL